MAIQEYKFMNETVKADPTLPTGQQAITIDQLNPVKPIDLPVTPVDTSDADALAAGVEAGQKTVDSYLKEQKVSSENTPYANQSSAVLERMQTLLPELGGQTDYRSQQEQQYNVPKYSQELQAANNETLIANAEYQTLKAEMQNQLDKLEAGASARGIDMRTLSGEQNALVREYNSKLALKSSEAALSYAKSQAASGNLTAALGLVDRAVDMRYKAKQEEYNQYEKQLNNIVPFLTKEQAEIAEARRQWNDDRQQVLADTKAKQKDNLKAVLDSGVTTRYMNKNGEIVRATDGTAFFSPEEFFADARVNSFAEAYKKGLITDYNPNAKAEQELVLGLAAQYDDAGISPQDDLRAAQMKLLGSRKYLKETRVTGGSGGSSASINSGVGGIVDAIIENPALYMTLTPTQRGQVAPVLQSLGFDLSQLTAKPLDASTNKELAQSQTAIDNLKDLKVKIQGNLQFVGPISGLQKYNPYSKARQVQADLDRVRQNVGKALEGGVLRKEDEEKYKKILATLTDTPETAIYKIDSLISAIERDMQNYLAQQKAAGKRVPVTPETVNPEELRTKYGY